MAQPATTSGTYSYSPTVGRLLGRSLRLCAAIASGETPTSDMAEDALFALEAMVKAWGASGIHVWAEDECVLFLQPNQPQYKLGPASTDRACLWSDLTVTTLMITAAPAAASLMVASSAGMLVGDQIGIQLDAGTNFWTQVASIAGGVVGLVAALPSQATSGAIAFDYTTPLMRPLRVPMARRYVYSSKIENPIITMSRFDYDYLPDKFNTGTPTQFFYDPQTGNGAYSSPLGLMNVWPAPVDNTGAIRFVAQRPIQDVGSIANILDFPTEWMAALQWNLAVEIAPEYDVPPERFQILSAKAQDWFAKASAWDREPESVFFGYAYEPAYRT